MRGRGGLVRGKGASKERPPALCLRFPSVVKRVAAYADTLVDACARVLINIIITRAQSTHFFFVVGGVMMMTERGDTQADRLRIPQRLCLMGETVRGTLCISRFRCLQSHPGHCPKSAGPNADDHTDAEMATDLLEGTSQ